MRTVLTTILFLFPVLAMAAPRILVDAVPTGAMLFNYSTIKVPFPDLEKVEAKEVESALAEVIAGVIPFAQQNGVTYVCLLSAAGERGSSYAVVGAQEKLSLRAKDGSFVIVLYQDGRNPSKHVTYSLAKPDGARKTGGFSIDKVSVPDGWTTESWLYFNLPRIQAEAMKDGATQIFLQTTGKGTPSPVVIPGVKEPLMMFPDHTAISASWYIQG
jgi:hypothetical protein